MSECTKVQLSRAQRVVDCFREHDRSSRYIVNGKKGKSHQQAIEGAIRGEWVEYGSYPDKKAYCHTCGRFHKPYWLKSCQHYSGDFKD